VRRLVPVAFFLTGATSLVFETVWFRRLTLLFGATGYAAATVFTAFMAGLALGALVAGRLSDRLASPRALLGAYAGLEAAVGIAALLLPVSLEALVPALRWLAPDPGVAPAAGVGVRFGLALLVLLVPTTGMGATLPLAARAWARSADRPDGALGPDTGLLYALNTFGAVAGTLVAGFVLLPALGVSATNLTAAGTNFLVAALVLALRPPRSVPPAAAPSPVPPEPGAPPRPAGALRAGLVLFGISGGVAMVYEEVWQRALQLVIGSSVYAFAILLAAFLLGLAAGAAAYSRRTAHQPGQPSNLAVAQLLVALAAAAGAGILDDLPAAFLVLLSAIPVSPAPALAAQSAIAASVVLVPAFFLGMSFPAMLAWSLGASPSAGGRTIGRVYAVNTVGAIVGSFLGGFVLIPTLGMQRTLLALVAVSALLATGYAILSASRRTLVAVGVGVVLLAALGPRLAAPWNLRAMNAGVFRISTALDLAAGIEEGSRASAGDASPHGPVPPLRREDVVRTGFEPVRRSIVRDHREGVTTTVAVTETTLETRAPGVALTSLALRVNGKPDASVTVLHAEGEPATRGTPLPAGDMETQVLCGALPAFLEGPASAQPNAAGGGGAERPRDFSPARGWVPRLNVAGGGRSPPSEDALVIGWGSGVTVATLAAVVPGRVVAVELEPEVVRAARPFAAVVPCDRRRVDLVLEDARNLLLLDDRRYGVIVSEPSNPWVAGASTLFTEDFFRLVRRRLSPGGTFVQWLQAYEIAPRTVRSVLAALTRVFRSVTVLRMVHSPGDLLLVCGDRPPRFRASPVPLPDVVRRMGIGGPEDVVARVVATTGRLRAFARGARPNTDDRPTVEFEAPLDLVRFRAWGSDRVVRAIVGPEDEVLAGAAPDRPRFLRALLDAGRPEAALRLGASGDLARAARAMVAARALADEDAHDQLPARLAAMRAAPSDRSRRDAVAAAYFALGYPERAAALYLFAPALPQAP